GIQDSQQVAQLIDEFNQGLQPQVLKHQSVASSVAAGVLGGNPISKGVRAYSTRSSPRGVRMYSTNTRYPTNPNAPLRDTTNEKPANVALIGARGYTGQALINLLTA